MENENSIDWEATITALRAENLSKMQSIKRLCDDYGLKLSEANEKVHCSLAWRDRKEIDEAFQNRFWDLVEKLDARYKRKPKDI